MNLHQNILTELLIGNVLFNLGPPSGPATKRCSTYTKTLACSTSSAMKPKRVCLASAPARCQSKEAQNLNKMKPTNPNAHTYDK